MVASAGTAEQVYTSKEFINGLVIQALHDNSTRISVGGPDTLATDNSESGIMLDAGETVTVYCENPSIVYIDALTNGEGCNFLLLES